MKRLGFAFSSLLFSPLLVSVAACGGSNDPPSASTSSADTDVSYYCNNGPELCYEFDVCGISAGQSDECTPEDGPGCQTYQQLLAAGRCRVQNFPVDCQNHWVEGVCTNPNPNPPAPTPAPTYGPPAPRACSGGIDQYGDTRFPMASGQELCGQNFSLWLCEDGTWVDQRVACS